MDCAYLNAFRILSGSVKNPPSFQLQHSVDFQVGFPYEMSAHADGASEEVALGSAGGVDEHHGGTLKRA
jgi:hypothetical protein